MLKMTGKMEQMISKKEDLCFDIIFKVLFNKLIEIVEGFI